MYKNMTHIKNQTNWLKKHYLCMSIKDSIMSIKLSDGNLTRFFTIITWTSNFFTFCFLLFKWLKIFPLFYLVNMQNSLPDDRVGNRPFRYFVLLCNHFKSLNLNLRNTTFFSQDVLFSFCLDSWLSLSVTALSFPSLALYLSFHYVAENWKWDFSTAPALHTLHWLAEK